MFRIIDVEQSRIRLEDNAVWCIRLNRVRLVVRTQSCGVLQTLLPAEVRLVHVEPVLGHGGPSKGNGNSALLTVGNMRCRLASNIDWLYIGPRQCTVV